MNGYSSYEVALNAANKLFADTSVSQEQTRDALRHLRDEIEVMIDAIQRDIMSKQVGTM